ncbi:cdc42-interacting protein 4 homolog isoform X1 [Ptychodera flava]|uniref:cdc42-interacting protein 4 homolog isoform X1 n=1 Tax=Ptychodera flava TaxID=63121 RepID=UPI00396A0ACD
MSWGIEIWDQYDVIEKHTQFGIEFVEKFQRFAKERSRIEQEYASSLRKLAKSFTPKKKSENHENGYTYSWSKGFSSVVKEVNDLAGQHELISETLTSQVIKASDELVKELKLDRRKFLQEGQKVQSALNASIKSLEQTKKNYESSYKASEHAKQKYSEADADMNLPRVQVDKARANMNTKIQYCEDCKNEYILQLDNTNTHQRNHYSTNMPQVFKQLQDMDEHRIDTLAEFYRRFADAHRKVIPIIGKCLDGMTAAGNSVNHVEDSKSVIERYKSGLNPPGDYEFEDLGKKDDDNTSTGSGGSGTPAGYRGTLSGTGRRKEKKRKGLIGMFHKQFHSLIIQPDENKEDFSDLPPTQRKKKLQQKIDEYTDKVNQQMKAREAMNKMKDVYTKNPAMGDPNSIDDQLAKNGKELDFLRTELQKYERYLTSMDSKMIKRTNSHSGYMADLEGHNSTPTGTPKSSNRRKSKVLDDENTYATSPVSSVTSPSTAASQRSSMSSQAASTAPTSPDTGIGDTSLNTTGSGYPPDEFSDSEDEEPTQQSGLEKVLFRCKALYDFQATSEGSIGMRAGEMLDVIERDSGDGWTKARRGGNEEGYVPTSYLEIPSS